MTDERPIRDWHTLTLDALERMRRAHQRGTGCHLTADMLHGLSVSFIGELWGQPEIVRHEDGERP